MSVESILLLAFLIVIPLLERLVRALRARAQRAEELAPKPPQTPPPVIPLPAVTPPPLTERHPAAERLSSADHVRARKIRQDPATRPMRDGSLPSRGRRVIPLAKPADLRRAIMLMAILGPCKALEGETGGMSRRQD